MGPKHHIDPRSTSHDGVAVLLSETAPDRDLHARVCVFGWFELPQIPVEFVVGVLAYCARVEYNEVGVAGTCRRLDVACGLQQPRDPFRIVHVHLTPVGANVVGATS